MSSGRGERPETCPCCQRRAERVMTTMRRRVVSAVAAAGLAVLAGLCLSGGSVQAKPAAGITVAVRNGIASQSPRPDLAAGPGVAGPEATAPEQRQGSDGDTGRIAVIAVAVAAVGAFTVLQVIAWSRARRPQASSGAVAGSVAATGTEKARRTREGRPRHRAS
jgi:hypothetical protein